MIRLSRSTWIAQVSKSVFMRVMGGRDFSMLLTVAAPIDSIGCYIRNTPNCVRSMGALREGTVSLAAALTIL